MEVGRDRETDKARQGKTERRERGVESGEWRESGEEERKERQIGTDRLTDDD
jgi:hypothetical protein